MCESFSKRVTACPLFEASRAKASPAGPEPMTAIFFLKTSGLVSKSFSWQALGFTRHEAIFR